MPVYVDPLISWPSKAKTPHCFKDKHSCHMYADTPAELHALAARIGLKREWFQDHRVVGHYDLTPAASSMDGPGTRYPMLRVTLCRRPLHKLGHLHPRRKPDEHQRRLKEHRRFLRELRAWQEAFFAVRSQLNPERLARYAKA